MTVAVTRRGKPVLAILAWGDYGSIIETLGILSDEDATGQLRQSMHEGKNGRSAPRKEAKRRLEPKEGCARKPG